MDSETTTMSMGEKIQATAQLLIDYEATIIVMGNAALTQELWEGLMHKGMLGKMYPTTILAKAILTTLGKIANEYLYETVLQYFKTGPYPKRTKETNDKDWFKLLKNASEQQS
jgi:hypothetical protein